MPINDYGKSVKLADVCHKVRVQEIVHVYKKSMVDTLEDSKIDIAGVLVPLTESRTGHGGIRLWFKCPLCMRRVGILYQGSDGVGCRLCFKLDYRSHRFKGMIESDLGKSVHFS